MTALLLVVAGVTAVDGGVRMGTGGAAVTVDFGGRWRGTVSLNRDGPYQVELSEGGFRINYADGSSRFEPFAVVSHGRGRATAAWGDLSWPATYRLQGDRLILRVAIDASTVLFTLRPAQTSRRP
jgi:hypothetical protein